MMSLSQVNDTDKARRDFLLSTWEEGMFFRRDLLRQMRSFIGRRIVCARHTVGLHVHLHTHVFAI